MVQLNDAQIAVIKTMVLEQLKRFEHLDAVNKQIVHYDVLLSIKRKIERS